jgi:hypothetical protein
MSYVRLLDEIWELTLRFILQGAGYPQKQPQQLHIAQNLGAYRGGSLPNVNQLGSNSIDLQVSE